MEDPDEDWIVEEHYYPCSYVDEDECKSKLSWIWNRGLDLGKKVMITGVAISSAPIVLPPLVFVSALGFAVSIPFGVLFASYTCTEKLMNKLLPMPVLSWEFQNLLMGGTGEDSDQFGEGVVMEDEVNKQMADLREDIEMRIELVEDENKKQQEVLGDKARLDKSFKDKGYEEDVGEYLDARPEGGLVEEVDKKPLIEESKDDEKPSPEVKRVIVVAGEGKKTNDNVMKPDELVVVSRVVKIEEKPAEITTGNEESNRQKEGTTASVEKIRDEVDNTGESGKKNKKKNKHHSKKLHKILGKKEDKHEENVEGKMSEQLGKKVDEPATKKDSVPVSSKPAGAQGSATNGHQHVQDRETDEKKGRTITSNPEKKGADVAGAVHKPKQPEPVPETVTAKSPKKMILSEEKLWDQINALRVIVGYTAPRHKSCIEELKDLYIFTGVELPSSFDKATDLEEAADKLQFLMSVVGVK